MRASERRKLEQRRAEILALNAALARRDLVEFGRSVVIVGGSNVCKQSHQMWQFHVQTGSWRKLRRTLQPRCNAAVCADPRSGKLYCCGGYAAGGVFLDTVEVHDPLTASPVLLPPMPRGVYGARALHSGRSLWVMGGQLCESVKATECVARYDFEQQTWNDGPQLPRGLRFLAACALADGSIVVCGGQALSGEAVANVERYMPSLGSTGRWVSLPKLRVARYSHGCCVMPDGRVGVFGSHMRSPSCEALDLRNLDAGWVSLPSMAHGRAHTCAATINGSVMVMGGTREGGAADERLCFTRNGDGGASSEWVLQSDRAIATSTVAPNSCKSSELAVVKGDIVTVVDNIKSASIWKVKDRTGCEGFVPASKLQVLESKWETVGLRQGKSNGTDASPPLRECAAVAIHLPCGGLQASARGN